MIKSRSFWIGAILLAIVPLLLIDIAVHRISWQKEVREEIITVVQNVYSFDKEQKAAILDQVFERNEKLTFLIYVKAFASLILLVLSIYFFRLYKKQGTVRLWKPVMMCMVVVGCFISAKLLLASGFGDNGKIKILELPANENSFANLYNANFKGKVMYIDFWGTTCGPCLQEFRDFTQPVKNRYRSRDDLNYLYVSQGNRYLWKQQIQKYNVEGYHIFLDLEQYEKLYRQSTQDTTSAVSMPRYLIIDKNGRIVVTDAKRPSDKDSLYAQLNRYLVQQPG